MNWKWKSIAVWPNSINIGTKNNETTDNHYTKEEASSVCDMLKREGFGGEGKIFPIKTYVIPI